MLKDIIRYNFKKMFFLDQVKKNQLIYLLTSILLTFILFFSLEFYTPFHSDDFSYGQMGLSLDKHFNHYMSWSGRVVADYASALILSLYNYHIIKSIIISLFSTSLCFLIIAIACKISNTPISWLKFIIIVGLYWVSNPTIGQINFWVVGACNYLVTTTIVAFLIYLFVTFKSAINHKLLPFIFIIATLAGCSNENMGITLFFIILLIFIFYKKQNNNIDYALLITILIGISIGSLILILAPGNFNRLNGEIFNEWNNLNLFEKLREHFHRSIKYFKIFKISLIFYLVNIIFLIINKQYQKILLSFIFLSASFFSLAIMVGSPYLPDRSFSGIFFFLLVAISCSIEPQLYKKSCRIIFNICLFCIFILFLEIYTWMFVSYQTTKTQEDIRNSHILYEKLEKGNNAIPTIPNYYFIKLRKPSNKFDLYHSPSQAKWYDVKNINLQEVNYDYSIIKTGHKISFINKTSYKISNAYYKDYLLCRKGSLIIESDQPLPQIIKIKYYEARKTLPTELILKDPIKLMGKYYIGISSNINNITSVFIE